MPNIIVIFGPPASGKAAIGSKVAGLMNYSFFYNHLTVNPVAALFGWMTPKFDQVLFEVRDMLFEHAANDSDIAGVVYTFAWACDDPKDIETINYFVSKFVKAGGNVYFVELLATLDTRIQRIKTPFRQKHKPNQENFEEEAERQRKFDEEYTMNTEGNLPLSYPHLIIDTEQSTEEESAWQIKQFVESYNDA